MQRRVAQSESDTFCWCKSTLSTAFLAPWRFCVILLIGLALQPGDFSRVLVSAAGEADDDCVVLRFAAG